MKGIGSLMVGPTRRLAIGASLLVAFFATNTLAADEEPVWVGDLSLAITNQTGTIDTFSGAFDAKGDRKSKENELGIRLTAVYGTSKEKGNDKNDTIQDSQTLSGNWKHIIHDRFFWETGSSVSRDSTQDLDVRARAATGPGYRFWRSDDEGTDFFDLVAGLGYRYEIFDTDTEPGDPDRGRKDQSNLADVVLGFEYKNRFFDDKLEYSHTGSAAVPANKPNAYILTSEILVAVPFSEAWSFRTGFLIQFVSDVPDQINSTTTRTTVGLGYKF